MASTGPSSIACRYFLQAGKCFYGAECKFAHDTAGQNESTTPAVAAPPAAASSRPFQPSSTLAAGAKEWTPASYEQTNTTIPTTPTKVPTTTTTTTATGVVSKLNANKTPFKPSGTIANTSSGIGRTVAAGAQPFYPSSSPIAWQQGDEFVPSGGGGNDDQDDGQHLDHQQHLDEMHLAGGDGDDVGGVELHHSDEIQYDDGTGVHGFNDLNMVDDGSHNVGGVGVGNVGGVVGVGTVRSFSGPPESIAPPTFLTSDVFLGSCTPVGGSAGNRPAVPPLQPQPSSSSSSTTPTPFMNTDLRTRLTHRLHLQTMRLQPDDPLFSNLPVTLDHERYHSLLPLPSDPAPIVPSGISNIDYATTHGGGSTSYKVTSSLDGRCYVVKRLNLNSIITHGGSNNGGIGSVSGNVNGGVRQGHLYEERGRTILSNWFEFGQQSYGGIEASSSSSSSYRPSHPTIIVPRDIFVTKEFDETNGHAVCLVYDYHPTASAIHPSFDAGKTVPIESIWNWTIQILQGLNDLHQYGLVAGEILKPGRVLLTTDQRSVKTHKRTSHVYNTNTNTHTTSHTNTPSLWTHTSPFLHPCSLVLYTSSFFLGFI